MAKQTLKSLLGSSDEREQVELNLNPVSIQPTIRSAGNYRVAVQQTPLTNSALQLADALKQGVGLYGQAVNIAQDKATQDVETMSEDDFDKFLAEGLDEESRNIFGYTKAYNQALAKKYYAEEMPKKLQAIAAELHKNPYAYKDPVQFESAAIAAVNGAYEEADELLGGSVFSEQANNALKSATKADFLAKQQAIYLERLPQITRQNASEGAFNAFSNITVAINAKAIIDTQIDSVTAAVGNRKEASAIVTKAYLDNIEALAKQEGQEALAQELLDELDTGDDEKKAGVQGRRQFGKDKKELFNTAENRLRIESLQDDIERGSISGYNAKIARARTAQAGIELEAFGLIAEAKGDETTALARFEEIDADIIKGSVTLNGVTYTDTIELNEIRKFTSEARNNKDLFVHNAKLNFVQQNTGSKRAAVNQLVNARTIQALNYDAAEILFAKNWDSGRNPDPTAEGVELITEFNRELEQLELQLADSLLSNTSLSQGDRITEYSKLYPSEVTEKMQEWMTGRLEQIAPDGQVKIEVETTIGKERYAEIVKQAAGDELYQQDLINAELANIEDETGAGSQGRNRPVRTNSVMSLGETITEGTIGSSPTFNYAKELEDNNPTGEAKVAAFNKLRKGILSKSVVRGIPYNSRLLAIGPHSSDDLNQRAEKTKKARDMAAYYGLDATELLDGTMGSVITRTGNNNRRLSAPINISTIFGNQVDFSSFPILFGGSISPIISFINDPNLSEIMSNNVYTEEAMILYEIAKKYNAPLEQLVAGQRQFLTKNNFLK